MTGMRVGDPADEDSSDAHLLRLGSLLSIVSGQRTLCEVSWIEISNSLAMSPTTCDVQGRCFGDTAAKS